MFAYMGLKRIRKPYSLFSLQCVKQLQIYRCKGVDRTLEDGGGLLETDKQEKWHFGFKAHPHTLG